MEFVFVIIVLFFDVWAIASVLQSSSSNGAKIAWAIGIAVFPLLGFLVWYFTGPRGDQATA